jgi:hypothetical protein
VPGGEKEGELDMPFGAFSCVCIVYGLDGVLHFWGHFAFCRTILVFGEAGVRYPINMLNDMLYLRVMRRSFIKLSTHYILSTTRYAQQAH